jgi:hypothetical protein
MTKRLPLLVSSLLITVGGAFGCGDSGSGGSGGGGNGNGGAGEGGQGGDGGGASGTYQAIPDTHCSPQNLLGRINLGGFPDAPYLQGDLWDRVNPTIGEPELENEHCAFHQAQGLCNGCAATEVCSHAGECVVDRRTVKTATLLLQSGSEEQTFTADPTIGGLSGEVTIGAADALFSATLAWDEMTIEAPAMKIAGVLENPAITLEGDSSMPGALDASWSGATEGHVFSTIPINHHAAGATFTHCAVPASEGGFHADAEMIDPLAVVTGLEFQGFTYAQVAAAETPLGCVEFQYGGFAFATF